MAAGENAKTLAEMGVRLEGSGWPEGDVIAKNVMDMCHASDAMKVVDAVINHVQVMPIGDHFSTEHAVDEKWRTKTPNGILLGISSEAEYKRKALLIHLSQIRQSMLNVFAHLSHTVLDVEVTQRGFNPEIPTPPTVDTVVEAALKKSDAA